MMTVLCGIGANRLFGDWEDLLREISEVGIECGDSFLGFQSHD